MVDKPLKKALFLGGVARIPMILMADFSFSYLGLGGAFNCFYFLPQFIFDLETSAYV